MILGDKNKRKDLWRKLSFKYKISATNENTLEEIWRFKTSFFWGAVLFLVFAFMLIAITSAMIITTPIRNYLPGYLDTEVRSEALQTAIKIENLEQQVNFQAAYIDNLRDVFMGVRSVDSVKMMDSILISESDPKLKKTIRESEYVRGYVEDEMFNLSVLVNDVDLPMTGTAFYKPVRGIITSKFGDDGSSNGIKINVGGRETVLAALEGSVLFAGYSVPDGYTVQIQHANGFVSVYKNMTMLLKEVGAKVATGEAIAVVNDQVKEKVKDAKQDPVIVTFELWYKGKAVDPQNYIYY